MSKRIQVIHVDKKGGKRLERTTRRRARKLMDRQRVNIQHLDLKVGPSGIEE